jgi:hypothetical protein
MPSVFNPTKLRLVRQKALERLGLDDSQVAIISYPKSGRTWLRALIGKAICQHYSIGEDLLLFTYTLTRNASVLSTSFTHDGSELLTRTPYRQMSVDRSRRRRQKVLFIVRDPRDVLVSCYFQAVKRINVFDGTISEFIRDDRFGIKKYMHFLNIWHLNQEVPREFLLLTYESMHMATEDILRQTLDFMGASVVPDETIQQAVQFASFDNLRSMEQSKQYKIDWMQPGDVNDPESYKVRRGKIGGYVDYLSSDDIAYVDRTVDEVGCPFLRQYYK